jgi:hypothetical protein
MLSEFMIPADYTMQQKVFGCFAAQAFIFDAGQLREMKAQSSPESKFCPH